MINSVSPSFKATYVKNASYTKEQSEVCEEIKSRLRSKDFYTNQKGETLEQEFERKGLDFFITPGDQKDNVKLSMLICAKKTDTDHIVDNRNELFSTDKNIGMINKNNINDIKLGAFIFKESLDEECKRFFNNILISVITIASILTGSFLCSKHPKETSEQAPKIEYVAPDTIKCL